MNNIKIELGVNSYRDNEPKLTKISFSAEFDNENIALDFMGKLNTLIFNFRQSLEIFSENGQVASFGAVSFDKDGNQI